MWSKFVAYWYNSPLWHPATWVAHGLVALAVATPFALCGAPWTGYAVGVSVYAFREAEEILKTRKLTYDNVGDVLGPAILCVLAVL